MTKHFCVISQYSITYFFSGYIMHWQPNNYIWKPDEDHGWVDVIVRLSVHDISGKKVIECCTGMLCHDLNTSLLSIKITILTEDIISLTPRFPLHKNAFHCFFFCAVCDFSNSNLKDKQYNEKTTPKSYKIEIKIPAHLGLTYGLLTT